MYKLPLTYTRHPFPGGWRFFHWVSKVGFSELCEIVAERFEGRTQPTFCVEGHCTGYELIFINEKSMAEFMLRFC